MYYALLIAPRGVQKLYVFLPNDVQQRNIPAGNKTPGK
jgi:hypothetical protein